MPSAFSEDEYSAQLLWFPLQIVARREFSSMALSPTTRVFPAAEGGCSINLLAAAGRFCFRNHPGRNGQGQYMPRLMVTAYGKLGHDVVYLAKSFLECLKESILLLLEIHLFTRTISKNFQQIL